MSYHATSLEETKCAGSLEAAASNIRGVIKDASMNERTKKMPFSMSSINILDPLQACKRHHKFTNLLKCPQDRM
jgi:hypothetical protein